METPHEDTIEERAKRGKEVLEKTRRLCRESYKKGIIPKYILMGVEDIQDYSDYLFKEKLISPISDSGALTIVGLEIIGDEGEILHLRGDLQEYKTTL